MTARKFPNPAIAERAKHQFEGFQAEILKVFLDAPTFGSSAIEFYFMDGEVKRIVHRKEESMLPEKGEKR